MRDSLGCLFFAPATILVQIKRMDQLAFHETKQPTYNEADVTYCRHTERGTSPYEVGFMTNLFMIPFWEKNATIQLVVVFIYEDKTPCLADLLGRP